MRKIIITALLISIAGLTSAQKYEKLYNKGIKLFNQEKFIEADSLFTLVIKKIPDDYNNPNIYFDRGVTRLYLSDTCGFCNDMKTAADLNDQVAKKNYKILCLKCDNQANNYYNQAHREFILKNYKASDSLLTLSLESYDFVDNVFLRGIVKLYMLDTVSFCADMAKISNISNEAHQNYQNMCRRNKITDNSIEYIQQPCACINESESEANQEEGYGNDVFFVVEDMPTFNGDNSDAFRIFIQENLKYPAEAQEKRMEGRVFVQFDICKNGELKNASIVRSAGEILDNEVLRLLSISPKWRPGFQRNEPVIVRFTFPVVFQLE